ncbi:phage head closure protein [Vibrio fortis]|uniref:phage head closure protein n=1 Tax=Vibrio fortis TaxID=212667 RepID=UPI0038CD10C6
MINFGRYRQQVEFKRLNNTRNEFNEQEEHLTSLFTRRARVLNKSYSTTQDKAPTAKKTIEVRIRYTKEVTDDLLILFQGELYNIDSVVDYDFSKTELVIVGVLR